jgi:hypothetical protein
VATEAGHGRCSIGRLRVFVIRIMNRKSVADVTHRLVAKLSISRHNV